MDEKYLLLNKKAEERIGIIRNLLSKEIKQKTNKEGFCVLNENILEGQILDLDIKKEIDRHFGCIYSDYKRKIEYILTKNYDIYDQKEREDIIQETWRKFYKNIFEYRLNSNLLSYLLRISQNILIDLKRKERNKNNIMQKVYVEEDNIRNKNENLQKQLEIKNMYDIVLNIAKDILNNDYYKIFELYYMKENKIKDIVNENNIPEGTVKATINRIKEKINIHLEKNNYDIKNFLS